MNAPAGITIKPNRKEKPMKKTIIFLLLCICLLLAGCTAQTAPQPIQPEPEPVL